MFYFDKTQQKGLTLVEVVVTIVIIAILAAIATPYVHSILARQEMRNVTYLIPHILQVAKQEAFILHRDVVVCPSISGDSCANQPLWHGYILTFVDDNQNRKKDAKEKVISVHPLEMKYATLTRLGARHANYIMFKQDNALPQGSQGSFMYCSLINQELNRRIVLNGMGLYRIEESTTCS